MVDGIVWLYLAVSKLIAVNILRLIQSEEFAPLILLGRFRQYIVLDLACS